MGVHVPDVSDPAAPGSRSQRKYGPQGRRGLAGFGRLVTVCRSLPIMQPGQPADMVIAHIEDVRPSTT
jgi:hypothetical protein